MSAAAAGLSLQPASALSERSNPSCAALFAHLAKEFGGMPLGQAKQGIPKGLWAEIARTHVNDYGYFGYCLFDE